MLVNTVLHDVTNGVVTAQQLVARPRDAEVLPHDALVFVETPELARVASLEVNHLDIGSVDTRLLFAAEAEDVLLDWNIFLKDRDRQLVYDHARVGRVIVARSDLAKVILQTVTTEEVLANVAAHRVIDDKLASRVNTAKVCDVKHVVVKDDKFSTTSNMVVEFFATHVVERQR